MDTKTLKTLLKAGEQELIDYKSEFYDIRNKDSRVSFVKDILAMANSCIRTDAYILCGVSQDRLTHKITVNGVPENLFVDDALWHETIARYVSHPVGFQITKVFSEAHGVHLVCVRVYRDQRRPLICTKDDGDKLTAGTIYFRNGSMNDVAKDLATIEQMIAEHALRNSAASLIDTDPTYNRYVKFPPAPYYTFFGRTKEIEAIYQRLINHHKNYLVALIGDGGIGKTSVAHSVALDALQKRDQGLVQLDDVIWISAKDQRIYEDQRLEINQEFRSLDDLFNKILLTFLNPSDIKGLSLDQKKNRVNMILDGTKFLFVLDNLEVFTQEELDHITEFIGNTPNGHKFLVTSRHDIRVNDFIELHGLDEATFTQYCEDVMSRFEISEPVAEGVRAQLPGLLNITNGNPLYLKFFLAQVKKGRSVGDIIQRRNTAGERGLKQYCFDTTLAQLSHHELLTMYAIASTSADSLTLDELVFMTRLERNELSRITDALIAVSLVDSSYHSGEKCFRMNQFLKAYLMEERRIPAGEVASLVGRSRLYYSMLDKVDAPTRLNFFLGDDLPKNKTASFNMTFDVLKSDVRLDAGLITEKLRDAALLYPGNYLVPFIKYFTSIVEKGKSSYHLYSDLNTDFTALIPYVANAPDLIGLYVWKSLLHLSLGKYDDITLDLSSVAVTTNEMYKDVGDALACCLQATALHLKAGDAYRNHRFKDHGRYRDQADELFSQHIETFMSQPFFYFIKKNIFNCYCTHVWHHRRENVPQRSMNPCYEDFPIFRGLSLTTKRTY